MVKKQASPVRVPEKSENVALNRLVGRESMCQGLNAKNKRFLSLCSLNRESVQNTKSLGDMKQVSSVKVP